MKKLFLLLVLLLSFAVFAQESEKAAIKDVIQTSYVEGLQNEGNIDKIDAGIHPGFNLIGIDKGDEMWVLPIDDWKKRTENAIKEGRFPRTGEDAVSVKFLDIDITGTAAVAKIEFFVGDKKMYVDYIALYKFESGWKMVNKTFYKFPEEK